MLEVIEGEKLDLEDKKSWWTSLRDKSAENKSVIQVGCQILFSFKVFKF
jgi:hypothetical protein